MQPPARAAARRPTGWLVVPWALLVGLIAGILVGLLTSLVARYGPVGNGWALNGNGALFVPFGFGPAVLCAGWTALALHAGNRRSWWFLGLGAGLVGLALVALSIVKLVVVGTSLPWLDGLIFLSVWLWTLVAPLAAIVVERPAGRDAFWHLGAGVCFLLAIGVGLFGVPGRTF